MSAETGYPIESASEAARTAYGKAIDERRLRNIWREAATAALTAALDAVDLFQIMAEHAEWQSYGPDGHGLRCSCGADLGEHPLSKPAYDVQHEHQAAVIRAAILGADS